MSFEVDALLGRLLVRLHRSLLQYVSQVSVWSPSDPSSSAAAQEIERLAARQAESVRALGAYLVEEKGRVDQGVFPVEFSDLQDLSLSFLLPQILRDQREAAAAVERALRDLDERVVSADGAEWAAALLQRVAANEREILAALEALEAALSAGAAAGAGRR